MTRLRPLLLAMLAPLLLGQAEPRLVPDVSHRDIEIRYSFSGAELLLFGAVQLSMIVWWLIRGERFGHWQMVGLILALCGLVFLLLPGSSAPSWHAALLMLASGVAWGIYSLRGRGTVNPLNATAGNFVRAVPLGILLSLAVWNQLQWDIPGLIYALLSGALASGVGYAIWYSALPGLTAIQAASVQLSVPLLTALAGALLLGEALTDRLMIAGTAILCGIALVMLTRKPEAA